MPNPLMNPVYPGYMPSSPQITSIHPPERSSLSIGQILSRAQKTHTINTPQQSRPSLGPSESPLSRSLNRSDRGLHISHNVDSVVNKVMDNLHNHELPRIQVFDERGTRFDSEGYLIEVIEKTKRQIKRYQEESRHVDRVIEELQNMVQRITERNDTMKFKRSELRKKRIESEDILFIRDRRYIELQRVKDRLQEGLLSNNARAEKNYLSSGISFHLENSSNFDELSGRTSVYLSDQGDPEVKFLLARVQNLKSLLSQEKSRKEIIHQPNF